MKLLSHRGWWNLPPEQNTPEAFARSFRAGHGLETDVRDRDRALVIAHDPPGTDAPAFANLLDLHQANGPGLTLALNIKADGLAPLLAATLAARPIHDYFCFDMSAPEMRRYAAAGLRFFTRQSDIEPEPLMLDQAAGVWIDAFEHDWIGPDVIARHLDAGRRVCVVSPELHRRDPRPLWERLRATPRHASQDFMLCTDLITQASTFFSL